VAYVVNPAEFRFLRRLRNLAAGLRRLTSRVFLAPLYAELDAVRARQAALEGQLNALLGRATDQDATARRLAAIEDALIELREHLGARDSLSTR
jgi:hypothetical protein